MGRTKTRSSFPFARIGRDVRVPTLPLRLVPPRQGRGHGSGWNRTIGIRFIRSALSPLSY